MLEEITEERVLKMSEGEDRLFDNIKKAHFNSDLKAKSLHPEDGCLEEVFKGIDTAKTLRRSLLGLDTSPRQNGKRFVEFLGLEIPGARPEAEKHHLVDPVTNEGHELNLGQLTGKSGYAAEADKALKFFFTRCQSPKTGLMTWGEHIYWDFNREGMGGQDANHEICGEWPFWDACYRLAPDASWKFAMGQWDHQIADKVTGDFSRHARWSEHGPGTGSDFPRYAGQMIACWADAYARKENKDRPDRPILLNAISVVVARMESNMTLAEAGFLVAGSDKANQRFAWPESNIKLARYLWQSAPLVEADLAGRMKKLALQQDHHFLGLPHTITSNGGFVSCMDSTTGIPRARSMNKPYTSTWSTGYGYEIHAGMANTCYARFRQIEKDHGEIAAQYKTLILATADQYLQQDPDREELLKPDAIANVIELLLNSHAISGEQKYLDRADHFGRLGVELFLGDGLPLPKATNQHTHYEAITGGPEFMQMLLELHKRLN